MKKQFIASLLATMFIGSSVFAYLGPNDKIKKPGKPKANCSPATAKYILEFNDVRALIEQGGSMFQNRQNGVAAYEVPKGSNRFAIYAGALWMGGTDVNGQLKLAALRFRQGNDFWPGPLSVIAGTGSYNPLFPVGDDATRNFGEANIDPDQCIAYDEFYTMRKAEVIRFNIWWECQAGISTECDDVIPPSNEELDRIYNWPAHGNVSEGQDYFLAPYYDRDQDGNYNPDNGDHPWYDDILGRDDIQCGFDRRISLFGDETHWWVFNDKGNIHTETNGDPIGMEIRAQAFCFATNDEVNRMTFYNYELINRGTQTLYDTYFAQYLDADVGNYSDDYAGCDVSRGLGYMYNGDLNDENDGGRLGYGLNPPAIGCDFFEGPYQDADGIDNPGPYFDNATQSNVVPTVVDALANNGIVYKGIGIGYSDGIIDNERFGMRRFTYYTSTSAYPYNDPGPAAEFYNFMEGQWANGSEMYYGGLGSTPGVLSDYMFPGTSDPLSWSTGGIDMTGQYPNGWDEATNNNPAGDRRFVQSAGPFTLKPGAINNITVGIVYGRSTEGSLLASVEAMKRADTKAQALFDACFKILSPPDAPKLTIQELDKELILMIDNPITSNNKGEMYAEIDEINIPDPSVDRKYRFEGYQIFQLKNQDVSVADISDPTKARLVAQCDLKNNISRIINFEFDEALGFSVPVEKVDGENKGIRHSFQILEDAFAQGARRLVNHKTYYYIAVAYAFNQFKKYDPNDALFLDGQKIPYISSRLNFDGTAISSTPAVPHNPMPEA
ncbi:MAG: T9SS C-terminal target domain-containing protein, partial [Bacteroidetes bacterium]|nr:T9SS C-terminal target domain-containing protein [Bacteroidota bacterium]